MDVTEAGVEDGRKTAHDHAQLCPFLVSAALNLRGLLLDCFNLLTNWFSMDR